MSGDVKALRTERIRFSCRMRFCIRDGPLPVLQGRYDKNCRYFYLTGLKCLGHVSIWDMTTR
ncbi:hypothetical protein LF95_10675 [Thalassospira sp. TSL5-1]|nr:hypothetical protein LF95_10675 [Thalassospira sp. TSL5-1]